MTPQRPEKLSVLHWLPSFFLPESAGEYLVLDDQFHFIVCDAEFEDNGSFVCFRAQCKSRGMIDNQVVLAHAKLEGKAGIVQTVNTGIPKLGSPIISHSSSEKPEPTMVNKVVDFISATKRAKRIGAHHVS